jgi:hypothetical protein
MAEWSPASPVNQQDTPGFAVLLGQGQRCAVGKLEFHLWEKVATVKFLHFCLSHNFPPLRIACFKKFLPNTVPQVEHLFLVSSALFYLLILNFQVRIEVILPFKIMFLQVENI